MCVYIRLACVCVVMSFVAYAFAETPPQVMELAAEMRDTGASVRGCLLPDGGLCFVSIGRSRYRPGAVNTCRELARSNAIKELTSALQTSFRAHDLTALQLKQEGDNTEVSAFVSSVSESTIDQMLKGVQDVSSGKNADGEMEVVIYSTSKMIDQSDAFQQSQLQWGDKGVVIALGVDEDRAMAEKNALRSAVEQVAGTLVVGKVSVNEREEMHKRLATTATALVEEYRITKDTKVEMEFQVEVLARVNKRKLYNSYRSYFKSLDNPAFCIVATDAALIRNFTQFFTDKGFNLVNDPNECQYLIKLDGRFKDRPTPGNQASAGTMLNLNISIVSLDGKRTLLTMNERQSKDSEVLTPDQRREEVSRRIFNKLEDRLHKAIQEMVIRMLDDADTVPSSVISTGTNINE